MASFPTTKRGIYVLTFDSLNLSWNEEPISKAPANKRIAGRLKRSNSLVAVILVIACIANRFLIAYVRMKLI